jgi:hypothetical protein
MSADDYTPEEAMRELLELTIKAARRCAYDLSHASGDVRDPELRQLFARRARHWLSIFNPANGPKDYRHRLHHTIDDLENQVDRLAALCKKHGINPDDPNGIPF